MIDSYLGKLIRAEGGAAWEDQEYSHLTPTFAAIGSWKLLGIGMPRERAQAMARFVRENHPLRRRKPERELHVFEFQQIQSLKWLGEDVSQFRPIVAQWKRPLEYPQVYEQHGYPVFEQEIVAMLCRELLGMPMDDVLPAFREYLASRQRKNGSFNNTPASDGSDGHVLNTYWGLLASKALGDPRPPEGLRDWLLGCQLPNGGFTYAPKAQHAAIDDVAYTRAALRCLNMIGATLPNPRGCINYLYSLWNTDYGFGDRPGWPSNPLATFYALDALDALDAKDALPPPFPVRPATQPSAEIPDDLNVYTIQIEAPGKGSPCDAVDLARSLKIHLWGAKNAPDGWVGAAQACADRARVPVTFFPANEEYGTCMHLPGLGTYSHISDLVAPPGADFGRPLPRDRANTLSEFRERRAVPLLGAGGRLVWQFGENEPYVRILLDESIERGLYAAISTFHFGNPDFTHSQPFLYRYRHLLPMIALQDAHANESWWWSDQLTGFRTVFLARRPTWEAWLQSLRRNWVMAFRRDAVSGEKLWQHGGGRGVRAFVMARQEQWRWWDNPAIARPAMTIAFVKQGDRFEGAAPKTGVAIRVRCAWQNTTTGLPKKALAELTELQIDGKPAGPQLTRATGPKGALNDVYWRLEIPAPAPGRHTAVAMGKWIESGQEFRCSLEFST